MNPRISITTAARAGKGRIVQGNKPDEIGPPTRGRHPSEYARTALSLSSPFYSNNFGIHLRKLGVLKLRYTKVDWQVLKIAKAIATRLS